MLVVSGSIRAALAKCDDAPLSADAHLLESQQIASLAVGETPESVYPTPACELRRAVAEWERLRGENVRLAAHCERLASELEGERKANALLNAGMGSVCEGRDVMKLELRAALARVAELEAIAKSAADS
jgi:hypothetical protein